MTTIAEQLEAQQRIQDLIARHAPLGESLDAICTMIEAQLPGGLCSIMLYDTERGTLSLAAGPSLSSDYHLALQDLAIGPTQGTCGATAHGLVPTITVDIEQDARWDGFRELARQEGLGACWSYPLLTREGKLLGTFALYYRTPRAPRDEELLLIRRAAGLTTLAIDRSREQRSLQENEQRYYSLFSRHPDAVFSLDLRGRFTSVNAETSRLTGLSAELLQGRPFASLVLPEHAGRAEAAFVGACQGRPQQDEISLYGPQGQRQEVDLTHLPIIIDGQVVGVFGIARDITRRKRYETQLAQQATHDPLTGLPNRRHFEARLGQLLADRSAAPPKVLILNLDDFKSINEGLGHQIGDQLLVAVSKRLQKLLIPRSILARLGGDEFALLLTATQDQAETVAVAEKLLTTLSQPYALEGHLVHVSASIGIAADAGPHQAADLLLHADLAVQEAKRQGRNTWQWYSGDATSVINGRVVLRRELQEGIAADRFELHYQPVVEAESGRLMCLEALVRWQHPEKGLLGPGDFIPLAEKTGQIIAIGQWVLQTACYDMAALDGGYAHLPVAVNISPLQFRRAGFLDDLRQVLADSGLAATRLELEITEGLLVGDIDGAIEILQALRQLGVRVALDDFGTGYSSLSYLRHLPITKVKLDRGFVQEIDRNRHNAAIVQGVITMAHHLDLLVVAEGVETKAEQRDLRRRGCDLLQGYRVGKPMALPALLAWLQRRTGRQSL